MKNLKLLLIFCIGLALIVLGGSIFSYYLLDQGYRNSGTIPLILSFVLAIFSITTGGYFLVEGWFKAKHDFWLPLSFVEPKFADTLICFKVTDSSSKYCIGYYDKTQDAWLAKTDDKPINIDLYAYWKFREDVIKDGK